MCGILATSSMSKSFDKEAKKIINRGPDQMDKLVGKDYQFYFNRLAIMDLHQSGMQPFYDDEVIVSANAEIYNYKQLKSRVDFKYQSTSDCEVLLPLYKKYGIHMFKLLDAEFACVIYDKKRNSWIAARDPIGIRPLFYGYLKHDQKIIFASEAKAIIGDVDKVFPFPPGHYYIDGKFVSYSDILAPKTYLDDTHEVIYQEIEKKLNQAVIKRLQSDAPIGFLLSGGLDSSLVCAIAKRHMKKPMHTFSIGMDTDPIDLKYAKQVSHYLNTIHHEVIMTKEDVIKVLPQVIKALESYDITTVRASIGMYLVSEYIHKHTHIKVLLTGEVSDELFGYKYTDFAPSPEAFQEDAEKRLKELYVYDVLRADRCLAAHALEARVPFGDIDFASYVMKIDPSKKMNTYDMGKYLLRRAFAKDYLPQDILYRQKAAFSDAVGHSMVDILKAYANKQYTDEAFASMKKQYMPIPLSKEALLYREIFEQFYPDQGHLIPGYWMPNQTWDGCQVNDPSARFLKNYDKSGE